MQSKDWYADYTQYPILNPKGPASGRVRVLRGGNWDDGRRLAYREGVAPDYRSDYIGFRVVVAD